ncbi:MAG: hypothetical protein KatS3mg033_2026 [Thermonema sp.]|nr:MAG: hypothetical protein KatS3mg027_2744 [Bacteroidia bacterium]GIV40226.1 MAG: hypothetical protein KatS3mg033_2026 [Thermonema sp.]
MQISGVETQTANPYTQLIITHKYLGILKYR